MIDQVKWPLNAPYETVYFQCRLECSGETQVAVLPKASCEVGMIVQFADYLSKRWTVVSVGPLNWTECP